LTRPRARDSRRPSPAARKEPRQSRLSLCRPVHRSDDFLPSLRIDPEAGPIGKQALGALTTTLDQELREGLSMDHRSPLKKILILFLDTKIEPSGL
jgi:hypothetical protein